MWGQESEPPEEMFALLQEFAISNEFLSASVTRREGNQLCLTTIASSAVGRCVLGTIFMDAGMTMMLKCDGCGMCRPVLDLLGVDLVAQLGKALRQMGERA